MVNIIGDEFPAGHPLHKIFKRNTLKISYSCMPNIKKPSTDTTRPNCHKPAQRAKKAHATEERKSCAQCPLKKCLVESIVYQATVSTNDNTSPQTYVGLTENFF
jgi:hypothetical protein